MFLSEAKVKDITEKINSLQKKKIIIIREKNKISFLQSSTPPIMCVFHAYILVRMYVRRFFNDINSQ